MNGATPIKRKRLANPRPSPQVTPAAITRPVVFISRAPAHSISPIAAQHPAASNSIAASIKPFGGQR